MCAWGPPFLTFQPGIQALRQAAEATAAAGAHKVYDTTGWGAAAEVSTAAAGAVGYG